jgi:hypothetical protein
MWTWITVVWTGLCMISCVRGAQDAGLTLAATSLFDGVTSAEARRQGAELATNLTVMFNLAVWAGGLLVIALLKFILGGASGSSEK